MSKITCVTGSRFSPGQEGFLWALTQARGYGTGVWVPEGLVKRMGIRCKDTSRPVEVGAENGGHLFYNLSQLCCSQEDVEKYLQVCREETEKEKGKNKIQSEESTMKNCVQSLATIEADDTPLNTNGEPFPVCFAQKMRNMSRHGSRYWATKEEASYIFGSPFHASFLRPENAIVLPGNELCRHPVYYNVCGTERPDVFNTKTCILYEPVSVYGRAYAPVLAVMMKRSAIRHNCLESRLWINTRRLEKTDLAISPGVQPLRLAYNGEFVRFVNVAMTTKPKLAEEFALHSYKVKYNHNVAGTK